MNMPRLPRTLAAALAALPAIAGCVSQQDHDRALETIRTLEGRNAELSSQLASAEATMTRQGVVIQDLEGNERNLRQNLSTLDDRAGQLGQRVAELQGNLGGINLGGLDPQTDLALRRLAAAQPDLLSYDSSRGMLRFRSDFTFDTASVELRPEARRSLRSLGGVLLNQAAEYDIRIVGHTDSQPITNANTLRRHPSNRHLSVHRAISVAAALSEAGVPLARIETSGWGETRPVVPNNPRGGTPQNRRVEIFVVPPMETAPPSPAPAGAPSMAPGEVGQPPERNLPVK